MIYLSTSTYCDIGLEKGIKNSKFGFCDVKFGFCGVKFGFCDVKFGFCDVKFGFCDVKFSKFKSKFKTRSQRRRSNCTPSTTAEQEGTAIDKNDNQHKMFA